MNSSPDKLRCVQAANAILGEGPSWDAAQGVLYWVDCSRPAIFRFDPNTGQTGHWPLPKRVGCVSPTQSGPAQRGRLVFADADGFAFLTLETGEITRISDPERHIPRNQFNDGKVDRAGRLWAGTMQDDCLEPTGSLYRLDLDLSIHRLDTEFTCSNGVGWSPDNRTMYFTDSMVRIIWAYKFDLRTGDLGARRIFARLKDHDGVPDGLTVDSEGFVWSAIWNGWRLIRYAPDGTIDREIPMPVQRPSSCMFGGPDLKTLFITSACVELDSPSLHKGPLAGALFALDTDVPGLPETPFGGS